MKKPRPFPLNRREFVLWGGGALASIALPLPETEGQDAETRQNSLASDPQRPQFHLLPARNWMNDPNGPIYFNGHYHMFFQFNPFGATWGNMSWNHAVSRDMLHWVLLPLALTPTAGSADSFGCFSGSAVQMGGRVYLIYTGTQISAPALATLKDGKIAVQESQCLAYSDDPHLIHWTKDKYPVIAVPPANLKVTGFRDPSVWKQNGWYFMTVGSGEEKVGGCVLLYRSRDLRHWTYLHKLVSGSWTGKPTVNPVDDGEMWECPDFFALDGGHVLIYSSQGKVHWQSGVLDVTRMIFTPSKSGLLDLDAFYAPKTQLDQHGRRILWGWIPERRSEQQMLRAGWSGAMSLPKVLSLDPDGTLRIRMLPELSTLRSGEIPTDSSLGRSVARLPNLAGEVFCDGQKGQPFSLTLTDQALDILHIAYDPLHHAFSVNGSEVFLHDQDRPTVRLFVDGSIAETVLGERIGYTSRFYSATHPALNIKVTSAGSAFRAWTVRPISADRLSTSSKSTEDGSGRQ